MGSRLHLPYGRTCRDHCWQVALPGSGRGCRPPIDALGTRAWDAWVEGHCLAHNARIAAFIWAGGIAPGTIRRRIPAAPPSPPHEFPRKTIPVVPGDSPFSELMYFCRYNRRSQVMSSGAVDERQRGDGGVETTLCEARSIRAKHSTRIECPGDRGRSRSIAAAKELGHRASPTSRHCASHYCHSELARHLPAKPVRW
jgi:hypothetical protein